MNTRLIRMEWRLLIRNPKTRWCAVALTLLLAAAFAADWRDAYVSANEAQAISAKERERWLAQDPKNPHSAAHYGIWAFKSPATLATLDPGIDPYVGRMVRVEAHRYNDALYRRAQDTTPFARSGISTVAQVIQVIVPLLCLLLAFGTVAADRERGTLRAALGNGATGVALLGSRTVALLLLALAAVALPSLALGVVANTTLGSTWAATWPRLLAWCVSHAAHAAAFVLLGVIISAISRTARAALAACVLTWVALCVIAPRLANAYVEKARPTPSWHAARMRAESEIKGYNAADLHQAREHAFQAKQSAAAEGARFDIRGAMLHDREQHDYSVFDAEIGGFERAIQRQDALFSKLAPLSPTLAAQVLSGAMAGSNLAHHTHFLASVEGYRRTLSDTMNLDLRDHPSVTGKPYLAGAELWSKVPPFDHRVPTLYTALETARTPMVSLALWLAISSVGAAIAARRLKP